MRAFLQLDRLELPVHLGWTDQERAALQTVVVGIGLAFPSPPRAGATDDLGDTIDYAALAERLRREAAERPYRLLEHLGAVLFRAAADSVGGRAAIRISVTKHPPVEGLHGGATFTIDQWPGVGGD